MKPNKPVGTKFKNAKRRERTARKNGLYLKLGPDQYAPKDLFAGLKNTVTMDDAIKRLSPQTQARIRRGIKKYGGIRMLSPQHALIARAAEEWLQDPEMMVTMATGIGISAERSCRLRSLWAKLPRSAQLTMTLFFGTIFSAHASRKQDSTRHAIKRLTTIHANKDTEEAHKQADAALCKLLKSLGYSDVVKNYRKIRKWYS